MKSLYERMKTKDLPTSHFETGMCKEAYLTLLNSYIAACNETIRKIELDTMYTHPSQPDIKINKLFSKSLAAQEHCELTANSNTTLRY